MERSCCQPKKLFVSLVRSALKQWKKNPNDKRTFFPESYIGMDRYNSRKAIVSQSPTLKEKFDILYETPELRVLSHDMKKFVFCVNTEEDFKRFSDLFERYAETNYCVDNKVKFQNFSLGPEILRVYHAMNKPTEAFNLLKNPQTFLCVCDLTALIVLQDLLYDNGMYQEVCDVFNIIREKQFHKRSFHFAPYIIYQAACYKMGTPESYKNVIAMYENFIKHNTTPYWPVLMYTVMFALKNSSLAIAVKYADGLDPAAVNLKLSALIKAGNYEYALNFYNSLGERPRILKSVAEDLCKSLENNETIQNESLTKKLEVFKEKCKQEDLIDKTLDELALDVIRSVKTMRNKQPLNMKGHGSNKKIE